MEEWEATVVDTADDSTTVNAVPTLVGGIYVNTSLSAHTVIIKDDTTAKLTIPASTAVGLLEIPGAFRCNTSLVIDPDNSSTGSITVFYKDLERR